MAIEREAKVFGIKIFIKLINQHIIACLGRSVLFRRLQCRGLVLFCQVWAGRGRMAYCDVIFDDIVEESPPPIKWNRCESVRESAGDAAETDVFL